jgi:two-component system LytT family response regulator
VFLDVQMPEVDGFGVLRALTPEQVPRVVFVTAYSEHAVRAFEVGAIDYLLKPYDLRRFEQAFLRVRADLDRGRGDYAKHLLAYLDRVAAAPKPTTLPSEASNGGPLDRLLIKEAGRVFFVRTAEIDWVEAADNYVRIHVGKDEYLVRQTIQSVAASFDLKQFVRIHRSTLVNLDSVVEIRQGITRDYLAVLKDGTELRMSDRYRRELEERGRPHSDAGH